MRWVPSVSRSLGLAGVLQVAVGHPLVDEYLEFLTARARPNTILAVAFDLKVFFCVVDKTPVRVTSGDVMAFIRSQRSSEQKVVRIDGTTGLSPRTIRRRLSSVSGLYAYLLARGDTSVASNPVPQGLTTRRERERPRRRPLVRAESTLPRVLSPAEVDALVKALRTQRDRAMVDAMVLGGLRRCEVLGLRLEDVRLGERRVFVADGKGGRQRLIPVSARFFSSLARYLDGERPAEAVSDRVFVALKGPRRGEPLSAYGIDEIMRGARSRAGLSHGTCHERPAVQHQLPLAGRRLSGEPPLDLVRRAREAPCTTAIETWRCSATRSSERPPTPPSPRRSGVRWCAPWPLENTHRAHDSFSRMPFHRDLAPAMLHRTAAHGEASAHRLVLRGTGSRRGHR